MSDQATEQHLQQVEQEILGLERLLGNATQAVTDAERVRDEVAVALASAQDLERTLRLSLMIPDLP